MASSSAYERSRTFTALITGANSGLGFASCCRIIDEFLHTRPSTQSIHLLFSTRSATKRNETLQRINKHLGNTLSSDNGSDNARWFGGRVTIEGVLVDLTRLTTVRKLAQDLVQRGQHIDAIILNAGIGGWKSGWAALNWPNAIYTMLFQFSHATTFPAFLNCNVGAVTKQQLPAAQGSVEKEPILGEVFTANVFGHYMLVHWLAPLFTSDSRIIWISSLSAQEQFFDARDFQHIATSEAYESSKRVTDLLVLTSELPSTEPYVSRYLSSSATKTSKSDTGAKPVMYVTHPGVVHTSISGMPWILNIFILAAFYLARLIGSPWHTITAYPGAVSAVWASLAPDNALRARELSEGKGKWGSVIDTHGEEGVKRTEVHGWDFCGIPGKIPPGSIAGSVGRDRYRKKQTAETRKQFEEDGLLVWKELESMRIEWEKRLNQQS